MPSLVQSLVVLAFSVMVTYFAAPAHLPSRESCSWMREQKHPERVGEWLLIEWPQTEAEPTKYWLTHFHSEPPGMRRLVRLAKARWRIELDYRELKEELGLDHYEDAIGWLASSRLFGQSRLCLPAL